MKLMACFKAFYFVIILGLIAACQPEQQEPVSAEPIQIVNEQVGTRPPIDALDWDTAKARRNRLEEVEYELHIDVADSTEQFSGEATIRFDLSDPTSDLTIDFSGGSTRWPLSLNARKAFCDRFT